VLEMTTRTFSGPMSVQTFRAAARGLADWALDRVKALTADGSGERVSLTLLSAASLPGGY